MSPYDAVSVNEALAEMFRYNAWANKVLFAACRELSEEQLDARVAGVSGTVRELLMHIAGGQETQILRSKGEHNEREMSRWSEWPGIDEVIELAMNTSDELISIARDLVDDDRIVLTYQGRDYAYPRRFFLVHAMEHSAEHRTEVKVALGHMGIATPDLDGWSYSEAAGYGQPVE